MQLAKQLKALVYNNNGVHKGFHKISQGYMELQIVRIMCNMANNLFIYFVIKLYSYPICIIYITPITHILVTKYIKLVVYRITNFKLTQLLGRPKSLA